MAEGVNVRLAGVLKGHVEHKVGVLGLYSSTSEYIRDLIRKDYQDDESLKWDQLYTELEPGIHAKADEFEAFSAEDILASARARKDA